MKKSHYILIVALLLVPVLSFAQHKNKIPKLELSVGGGAGYGGYLTKFDDSPWISHIAQGGDHTAYNFPHTYLWIGGHGGLYVDYNFTKNWGIISGLEAAYYETEFQFEDGNRLLCTFSNTVEVSSAKTENWYALSVESWESQRMLSLQIPIMGKYMVSVSPRKGHQYYVAAGFKLGFHILSQSWYETGERADIAKFASRTRLNDVETSSIKTVNAPDLNLPLTNVDTQKNFSYENFKIKDGEGYYPVKANPLDVLVSLDTGFRWNLGHGLGLYTGLYCDFGLLRPVAREKGSKIYSLDLSQAKLEQLEGGGSWNGRIQYEKTSILAADGPDVPYVSDKDVHTFPTNDNPLAKSIHHLQAGLKLRFSISLK